jgi:hypothetical protein
MFVSERLIMNRSNKSNENIEKTSEYQSLNQTSDMAGNLTRSPGLNGGKPRAGQPAHRNASTK